jgi:hypothetical protein
LRFPLPILIPRDTPCSSVIRRWHVRPILTSELSLTTPHPTKPEEEEEKKANFRTYVLHSTGGYKGQSNVNFFFRVCWVMVACLLMMAASDTKNMVIKPVRPNKVLQEHESNVISLNKFIRRSRDLLIIKSLYYSLQVSDCYQRVMAKS